MSKSEDTPLEMDTQDDDEPQVIFDSKSKGRRRRHRKKHTVPTQPQPEPVIIDDEFDEIEELQSISPPESPAFRPMPIEDNDTVILSDTDEEDVKPVPSEFNDSVKAEVNPTCKTFNIELICCFFIFRPWLLVRRVRVMKRPL